MSIDRIAALLAKAERTDNAEEADAYLMKAQTLATAASIDLAMARSRTAKKEQREQPEMRTVIIGEKGKRANRHLISLFIAVSQANDVKVDIASDSTFVIAYGMPSDLDVVNALFSSLAVQMTAAAQTWLAVGPWRRETYVAVVKEGGRSRQVLKQHTAQTARVAFYQAFVPRIQERLTQAREAATEQAYRAPAESDGIDRSLVLRAKSAEIGDFHRSTSKARGSWAGYTGGVRADGGSSGNAGRRAASLARLAAQQALPGKRPVQGSAP